MVFNPCHHYRVLLRQMNSADGWAGRQQSADGCDCARTRGCGGASRWFIIQADKASRPHESRRIFFFLLSLPLRGNSVKRPGIQSSHSKLDRFHLRFSALWRQKLSHAYGLRCTEGAPSAPCSPGAGVVQDWLLCPFPRGEHGFLFSSGNEPRPLVLGAHRLIFNSFHILRRTL